MFSSNHFSISKLLTAFLISTLAILLLSFTAFGADYYVSSDGNDSNPGSLQASFKTIQKALDTTKPGDTVYIRGGTYKEKLTVNTSGTTGNPITIQNYQNERAIIDGTGVSGSYIIYIYNKNYITVKGLEICNNSLGHTPTGIFIEGWGDGIEILNNKVYGIKTTQDAHGIAAYGTNGSKPLTNLLIQGNEVYDCILGSSESVTVNGNVQYFKILNNIVHDNDNIGICCIGFEEIASSNDQARDGIVSDNIVYNITSKNNPAYKGETCADGIYVDGGKDILIERNIVYNCDIGIEVASEHYNKISSGMLVKNNLVYGCGLFGLSIGGAYSENGYADKCIITNNTFYNNSVGINIQKTLSNYILNNIIYDEDTPYYGKVGSNILKNNLWYSPRGNTDKLSPFADPKFVNPSKNDFRISSDSPARNAGIYEIPLSEMDLDGNARICEGIVDIGAYEFTTNIEPTPIPTPTSTPTLEPTPTPSPTSTPTLKPTPSPSPTSTPTLKPTPTPSPTSTPTLESTPAPTPTSIPTLESTPAPTPTSIPTLEPTPSPSPTSIPTLEPTPSPIPYETDDGNKMKDATIIDVDKERIAAIDYDGDNDWFKFTTTTKGTYIIQSFGNEVDTWGELINNRGRVISSNDDNGTNGNFKIVEKLDAGKTYYIYVDGTKLGRYSIKVELSSK